MKMTKFKGSVLVLSTALLLAGCSPVQNQSVEKEKSVVAIEATLESMPEIIHYYGHMEPETVKNYAFKTGGKLESMTVEVGDSVLKGDLLATLDNYEYNLGYEASNEQVRLALLDEEKALSALNFYKDLYNDMKTLYDSGAIAAQDFNEISLQYDVKQKEYAQAIKVKEQAQIDLAYKTQTIEDTSLIADTDGIVVETLYKEGELIGQGYPAVIVRSYAQTAKINVSLDDIKKIQLEDEANVLIDDVTYQGHVTHIDLTPDQLSRTYTIEVTLDTDEPFVLGQDCDVLIQEAEIEGIWLDINHIMNDGEDYVYIIKDERAVRRNIEIHEIYNDKVRITGIESGDLVITKGKNTLVEGYKVSLENEGDLDE